MAAMQNLFAIGTVVSLASWPSSAFLLGSNFGIPTINRTFDYIIVGGGNAGLTIASRLSENPNLQVAVVEAGSFYEISTGNTSQIPALESLYWNGKDPKDTNPLVDWGFVTTPQAGINNQVVHYERGKTLGGCSALNYMAYERTTVGALQSWATLANDSSYEYNSFSQYYYKSTNFTPPDNAKRAANSTPSYDKSTLGNAGPLNIGYPNYALAFSSWMPAALSALGLNSTKGFTNGILDGYSWSMSTINHTTGTRDSSETSFLRAALGRPNLAIYVDTMAEKVLFNGKTANGVLVNTRGYSYQLTAKKEVIVSAGVFQSPQLLMVSGIGPSNTLNHFGIPVVMDLPGVGQNMNDHIYYGSNYRVNVETASSLAYGDNLYRANDLFNNEQSGMLSNNGGDFLAYENFPSHLKANFSTQTINQLAQYPADWPEIEYLFIPAYTGTQEYPGRNDPTDGYQYATIVASYMKPISRGNITLRSASMDDAPAINPAWLTSKADQEQVVAAFKRVREIWNTDVLKQHLNIGPEYFPGANVSSDAQIFAAIQQDFNTVFHATSTCKMGASSDKMAVVDANARVYGMKNLRVVDASALPFLPPGLPMGTVYALAEKISDDILHGR